MDITRPLDIDRVADSPADKCLGIEENNTNTNIARIRELLLLLRSELDAVTSEIETSRCTAFEVLLIRCKDVTLSTENLLNGLSAASGKSSNASEVLWNGQLLSSVEDDLYNCLNKLLSFRSPAFTESESGSITEVEVAKNTFDKLAKEVLDCSDRILPPVLNYNSLPTTLIVYELLLVSESGPHAAGDERVFCTEACLYDYSEKERRSLRFRCCCNGAPHEGHMNYKIPPGKSLLKEEIGRDGLRKWCILVLKPQTYEVVVVRLSGVPPTYIGNIQTLSTKIAIAYLNSHAASSKTPVKLATSQENRPRVLDMIQNDWEFPSTKIVKVTYELAGTQSLLTKQPYVELKHFCKIPSHSDIGGGMPVNFYPLSYFSIIIRESRSEQGSREVRATESLRICHESNPLGRLVVTLQNTTIAPAGTQRQESKDCYIHFHFDDCKDAEAFSSYVRASQDRLRAMFIERPFEDEKMVYFREFPIITRNSLTSKMRFVIVSSQHEYRAIVSRDGNAGAVCFDLKNKALEVAQNGLVKSLEDVDIWLSDYNFDGRLFVSQMKWEQLTSQGRRKSIQGATFIKSDHERTADDWLDEVDGLIRVMRGSKMEAYDRVKIAVIDSGLHDTERSRYRVEYKDFTNETSNDSWHGTCCAGIIRDIYEDARLYIARVFERNHADEIDGPLRMARAIHWAIEPPCSVDIISISAGFRNYSKELDDAVTRAKAAGVLVIAAASNWQNTSSVAFPARHNLSTMCIYSTNTGNQSSNFNPEPRADTPNFAILGEGFQHPDQRRNERMSGTSMATAVAAGLAARILDFSRQMDNMSSIFRAQDVGKLPGMLSIFSSMSKPAGNLRYVSPLELLPLRHGVNRDADRQRVREVLSQAMERAN